MIADKPHLTPKTMTEEDIKLSAENQKRKMKY